MFAASLDLERLPAALLGAGPRLAARVRLVAEAGAPFRVFAPDAGPEVLAAAGSALYHRWPEQGELDEFRVLLVAGLTHDDAAYWAGIARELRLLVNVEDDLPLCDFHTPAVVRRGDLMLTVATGGKSPALARRLKRHLESSFGKEWAGRVRDLAARRNAWRDAGHDMSEVAQLSDRYIDEQGWLP